MEVGGVLSIVAGALALIGFVALAWAKFRTTSDETITKLLREERDAYRDKSERLEKALTALEQRVTSLENENRTLRALHDSREEMASLRRVMTDGFATLATLLKDARGEVWLGS